MSTTTATALGSRGADASQAGRIGLANYLLILAQLGLVLLLMRQFQIESAAFLRLAVLAFAGFAIHAWLPLRFRLPFFLVLSLAGIALVMGGPNAIWLLGIGLVLVGICHLPLAPAWRGALLLAAAIVLALQRAGHLPHPWSDALWPILGAMFMFRMIIYFYDLRHERIPPAPTQSLAYFFMLPGACFPLFPVIDFKTFRRNYFDDDAYRIYQVGVEWMVRGVMQLILYRIVYYYLTLAPHEVTTPDQLVQYLVANFLLYLRVSGLFHLIVGMLYLYGFRLPETHNRYLLASSFTDFWRRINIYWKDFMQKVFYYPAVFKLRKLGTEKALVIATLFVFLMTWFLHAWQWFWLRGTILFVPQDILFWTILGLLVVANSLWEMRHGRKRSLGAPTRTWRSVAVLAARSYATFWFICILWSFWTAESIDAWLSLWGALGAAPTAAVLIYPGIILAVIVLGTIPRDAVRNLRASAQDAGTWSRGLIGTVGLLVVMVGVSVEGVHSRIDTRFGTFVHSLRSGQLSRLDMARMERGYYENLLSVDRFNSQLWEVYMNKPANWLDNDNTNLKHFVGGFAQVELIPSFVRSTKYGTISINRFGMRDQAYDQVPAPGTFRIAVLGASSVMGWGVGDGETFEALVEARLNRDRVGGTISRFELLNLGIPGYNPPQQLVAAQKAFGFQPHMLFYVATGRESQRAAEYLADVVKKGIEIPYPPLRDIVRAAGIDAGMDQAVAVKRLLPHGEAIVAFVYHWIADESRARGIRPVWIFLPLIPEGSWQEVSAETRASAGAAGFEMIDLSGVFEGREAADISLAEWDSHPNALGHRLLAERLFTQLETRRDTLFQPLH
jgi:D-alanyl-lipoteichoic acid acyltransferase DltB (MBOAT superfamily)